MSKEHEPNISMSQWQYLDDDDDKTPMNNLSPIRKNNKNGGKQKRTGRPQINKRKVFEVEEQEYERERNNNHEPKITNQ